MTDLVPARPVPGAARPFTFPPFERATLDNGVRVITCDLPGRPFAVAKLILEAGASNESADRAGTAVLTARALTEGTERFAGDAFAEAAEAVGADVRAAADWETLTVSGTAPSSRLEQVLELVCEAARRPAFPANEVERLKAERLNQIRQQDAQPFPRALRAFYEATYTPGSLYHRRLGGSDATVPAIGREDLAAFHATFATPASATLIVAGDLGSVPVHKLAHELLGDWQTAEPHRPPVRNEEATRTTSVTIVDRRGAVQSNIVLGHGGIARGEPDELAVTLMNLVLGGTFNSRLNDKLREEKGYTYGARSAFDAGRLAGPLFAYAPVETSVTAPAIADAIAIVRALHDAGATADELDAVRAYETGRFAVRFETPEAIVNGIAELVVYGLADDYFDSYASALARIGLPDVNAAARDRLHPDRLAVVVVGDAETLAEPLGAFGTLSVIEDAP